MVQEDRASWQWPAHFVVRNQDHVEKLEDFEEEFRKSKLFKRLVADMSVQEVAEALTPEQLQN